MEREIQFVTVAGREIAVALVVCPTCKILDLGTTFQVDCVPVHAQFNFEVGRRETLTAMCGKGHQWSIELPESS